MEINYNIISTIDILGMVQGLLFGTMLLWLHSKKSKPTFYLGLFILLFSLEPIPYILNDLGLLQEYPRLELLPVHFYFSAYPLFYIYIQKISVLNSKNPSYWTLIPGLVEITAGIVIFFLPIATKLDLKSSSYAIIYFVLGLGYSIFIGVLIIRWILRHQREVGNQFSQILGRELNWVKLFTYASIGFQLFLLVNFFTNNIYWYYSITVFNIILIYWVSFKGITQENIVSLYLSFPKWNETFSVKNEQKAIVSAKETVIVPSSKKPEFMTRKDMLEVIKTVEDYIINSKCYAKSDLTIVDITEATNIQPKRISHSLNKQKGVNFNNYINKFRIEKAKELFKDNSTENLSVEGIGIEAGFHSKATFYSSFKKFEGCTPASYRNS